MPACLLKLAGLRLGYPETVPALGVLSSTTFAARVQTDRHLPTLRLPGWSRNIVIAGIGLLVGVAFAIGSLRFVEAVVVSSELDTIRTVAQLTTTPMARQTPGSFVHAPVSSPPSDGRRRAWKPLATSSRARPSTVATPSTPVIAPAIDTPPDAEHVLSTATIGTEASTTASTEVEGPRRPGIPGGAAPG